MKTQNTKPQILALEDHKKKGNTKPQVLALEDHENTKDHENMKYQNADFVSGRSQRKERSNHEFWPWKIIHSPEQLG